MQTHTLSLSPAAPAAPNKHNARYKHNTSYDNISLSLYIYILTILAMMMKAFIIINAT